MLTVGQKLWLVYNDKRLNRQLEVEVVKVGRTWATLNGNHGRIDLETLELDGGNYSPPACCYLSREAYESERDLGIAWGKFRRDIGNMFGCMPKGVTIENINQARALLGLDKE